MVHESLLSAWPRLVRWRTEDEGSAQLRDQLRQAAHLWVEKGQPDDLLWTGTSYQEYQVWRARYPGGLSDQEETFARAMAARAGRRRRMRRIAYTATMTAVLGVAVAVGISRQQAVTASRRAEAAQLLALGRLKLADHPNAALAYAIASLERNDNDQARRFAVEALAQGPPALFMVDKVASWRAEWSHDGAHMAVSGASGLEIVSRDSGEQRVLSPTPAFPVGFTHNDRRLVTNLLGSTTALQFWALPEGGLERTQPLPGIQGLVPLPGDQLLGFEPDMKLPREQRTQLLHRIRLDEAADQVLGRWQAHGFGDWDVDGDGRWILYWQRGQFFRQRLDDLSAAPLVVGSHDAEATVWAHQWRDRAVTADEHGEVRVWNVAEGRLERTVKSPTDARSLALDPRGRFVAAKPYDSTWPPRTLVLFDLAAPPSAEPTLLLAGEYNQLNSMSFSPDGAWLATTHDGNVILWHTAGVRPVVLGRHDPINVIVAFTPDGRLLSASDKGVLKSWPLSPDGGQGVRVLWSQPDAWLGFSGSLQVDRRGRFVIANSTGDGKLLVVPFDGSPVTAYQSQIASSSDHVGTVGPALDPSGRFVAVSVWQFGRPDLTAVRVRDLATGEERVLDTRPKGDSAWKNEDDSRAWAWPVWLPDGRLVTDGASGLRVWDLRSGISQLLRPAARVTGEPLWLRTDPAGRNIVRLQAAISDVSDLSVSELSMFDLASRTTRIITSHGNRLRSFALDPRGEILVTGDLSGVVRVGPLTGAEPHLLIGHKGKVTSVAVSPDGRWIASGSDDGTIRLWPMPDLSKPPLHTLPYDRLLAMLKALTNLRAVRDPASDAGWKIEIGPFPGWARVPVWHP